MVRMPSPHPMSERLAHEARWRAGPVGEPFPGRVLGPDRWMFEGGEFALRTGTGFAFHYVPGHGVTVEQDPDADPAELGLWLNGSVYAAIACLHGLYPIHASAVAHEGRVHAFTGASGAGKSTLVACLGQRGHPLFCDDTLLLDLSNPERILALPGHKRLKLTDHALALTGAAAEGPVGAGTGKSYAVPPGGICREALPLSSLTFLEEGDDCALAPISGAARFARLDDDHYTQQIYRGAQRPALADLFALRARIAGGIAMARLIRPLSDAGFAKSLDLAETVIFDTREEPAR